MKVAILGYGTVGAGVVDIIESQFSHITISHILVKDESELKDHRFTKDFTDILNDDEVECVMEMIVGDNPAYRFLTSALKKGKHVITSNKTTVAAHLEEYVQLAKENNCQFRFEASVAGGIPWIASLSKGKRIDEITKIEGIINGTTNYILDHMFKDGCDFQEILQQAQQLGYAEKNPSDDVDGFDVMRKIMISSSLSYESIIALDDIWVFGIRNLTKVIVDYMKENNRVIRLIGQSTRNGERGYLSVEPVAFKATAQMASIDENNNCVAFEGKTIGRLAFSGQGAGKYPTANAMVQDLLDIVDHRKDELSFTNKLIIDKEMDKSSYVVCTKEVQLCSDWIKKIDGNIIETIEMTPLEKENLIKQILEKDEACFYARLV